ncbi:sensor histidine kinase, partial [Halobellus sp. Atlit-31R]
ATSAQVRLVLDESAQTLRIVVADDGNGFDPASASEGIGIIGMRERVYAVHGVMDVRSSVGGGTVVAITLPLHAPATVSTIPPV